MFRKDKCVFKRLVFAHSPLFFAPPGFSCWKFVSTSVNFKFIHIPTHIALLSLDIIKFKFIHIFHITILYGFFTRQPAQLDSKS